MSLPCKEMKCIVYPICRNRKKIDCPELNKYYSNLRKRYSRQRTWSIIQQDLKELNFQLYLSPTQIPTVPIKGILMNIWWDIDE